jgi:asparagine synthase (glutamine-hydrolysing)
MCGIAGVIRLGSSDETRAEDVAIVGGILSALQRRGPDGTKMLRVHEQVLFGATRLAIVDTNNPLAVCPLTSPRWQTALVFNGELYDYRALRKRLSHDWQFETECDSEVALALLTLEGPHKLQEQDGMFSYAFYDGRSQRCFLGVDAAGQKPLFYTESEGLCAFSSSIESLLRQTPSKKSFCYDTLAQTLLLRFPIGDATHIREVKRVRGGATVCIDVRNLDRSTTSTPYSLTATAASADSYAQNLDEVALTATRATIPAEMNYALLLSGGLDSSSLVTGITDPARATAYSIGFEKLAGREIYPAPFDEFEFSSLVAAESNIRHQIYRLDRESFCSSMLKWCGVADEPLGTADTVALFFLLSQISDVRVLLSGSGIDELFDGYEQGAQLSARGVLAQELGSGYARSCTWLYEVEAAKLFRSGDPTGSVAHALQSMIDPYLTQTQDVRKLTQLINFQTRGSTYEFRQLDQTSMHHSLEARAPYAVRSFVNVALGCNPEWYHTSDSDKWIVKKAFQGRLNPRILARRKAGFPIPSQLWFSPEYEKIIEERLLGDEASPLWDVVDKGYLAECWRSGLATKRNVFYRMLNASEVLSRHKALL